MKQLDKWWIVLIASQLVIQLSCKDNISGFKNEELKNWYGQVISEWVSSILKPDSTVWTWGNNSAGTLGNGTNQNCDYPVKVLNLKSIISIDFFCGAAFAADNDGNIWFWGNYVIWLGPPDIDTNVTKPIKISSLKNVTSISVWGTRVNLLTKDGSVWYIIMETEFPGVYEGPLQYTGLNNVISISKFYALSKNGKIIRLSNHEELSNIPEGVIALQSTQQRNIILKNDGTVLAWGKNDLGQLGNGTFKDSEVPTKVNNLSNVVAISSNYDSNLALKKDGTVWFWGFIGKQEDTLKCQNIPIKIDGLDNVVLIYAAEKSMVMKKDGTYWTFKSYNLIPKKVQF